MTDPYKVLNVARNASDDEIKKAYRTLARKYHPDNYAGGDLADLAQEKMKEINEAYDQIQKERAASKGGTGYGYGAGYGYGSQGSSSQSSGGAEVLANVRRMISMGNYSEAGVLLDGIAQGARNAEWNYLKGCVLQQKGWYFDAQRYFEIACYLEPSNREYQAALQNIRSSAGHYGRTEAGVDLCSPCNICGFMICADGLCECCGGDLLRCC